MALNKNHEFEELNGVKCGIVEKNVKPERVAFFKEILELNGYTVVTVPTPPPKIAPPPPPVAEGLPKAMPKENEPIPASASADSSAKVSTSVEATADKPETFTVGVTDYTFNPINAIFGRMLKTKDGHFVTWAYWNQEEPVSNDEVPYYEK